MLGAIYDGCDNDTIDDVLNAAKDIVGGIMYPSSDFHDPD
jgi:hypothetical protein